ncbi:MAG: ATP phosphoribosyltransferase regulatory subunit [Planctomycetes bacterium]|nr:ATP phosphoribosyltransferase regulatory subunit [Planctomycetota bacterium]
MSFQALPGFRDFYPEEMAIRRHVEAAWHAAAKAAGFEEVDGPPLESLELLKAKSGEAIVEELYAFTDKGGREIALRAELTPTVGRMIAARAAALRKPVKWYATPQLFRYQRQQRGRLREHIQWNADIFGASEIGSDAELLSVALDALRRLGLTEKDVKVRVSHRGVMAERVRTSMGDDAVEATLRLIDKGELSPAQAAELLVAFDVAAIPELDGLHAACEDLGIEGFLEFDPRIVRGLAYYTGLVWEIFDRGEKLRAVAGGGRYDMLIERLGGPKMPALGFGMGDVVLGELLKDKGKLPPGPPRIDVLVVPIGDEMLAPARQVVRRLRLSGERAEAPYAPMKVGKAFQAAESYGARRVVLVGPDEWRLGKVKVKDLRSREEAVREVDKL